MIPKNPDSPTPPMELKRSSSHNSKQPWFKRTQDFFGWKKNIKISNDSNRPIVFIIEYGKTETTVNTKGVLGASCGNGEAHYEKETESLYLPPDPVVLVVGAKETKKVEVFERDLFVTITSKDVFGNEFTHAKNVLMRSNQDWNFKEKHLKDYVWKQTDGYYIWEKEKTACRLCAFLQWIGKSSKFTQTQDNVS